MIEMTREEFATVYAALRLANTPYSDDEIPLVVAAEGKAWEVVQEVRHRAGLPEWDPACGAGPIS
jgi:hypothetical protein